MANTLAPFGLRQLRMWEGTQGTWGAEQFLIGSTDTTPIYTGDPVVLQTALVSTAEGAASPGSWGSYVTQGTSICQATITSTGISAVRGVFLGCEYYSPTVNRMLFSPYWPGTGVSSAVDGRALVASDPRMLWIIQASTGAVIGSSNVGSTFTLSTGSSLGNATTGVSGGYLNSSAAISANTVSTTGGFVQLVDFYSNFAPPGGGGMPGLGVGFSYGATVPIINGTDNTAGGQIVVVRFNPNFSLYT